MEAKIQLSKRIKKNNFGSKNFKNMKIAALLTGKGSSTLKNKNLLKINNKPILYYPCAEAKKIKDIDKFFVSILTTPKIRSPKRNWSFTLSFEILTNSNILKILSFLKYLDESK